MEGFAKMPAVGTLGSSRTWGSTRGRPGSSFHEKEEEEEEEDNKRRLAAEAVEALVTRPQPGTWGPAFDYMGAAVSAERGPVSTQLPGEYLQPPSPNLLSPTHTLPGPTQRAFGRRA